MTRYFDTHAHYDDRRYKDDRDDLLEGLPERGVKLVLVPGCNLRSSRDAAALSERWPYIYAAAGVHPHDAKSVGAGTPGALRDLAGRGKVMAIGEIGLDYHYDYSPRDVQRECFAMQLGLAEELGMPVIIHDREAHADTLDILRGFNVRAVYHCYSGTLEMAKTIIGLGHYISFTGSITFKGARHAVETAAWLPCDRYMLETDAPYLTPFPHRGERNDSSFLPYVAEAVARARNTDAETVAAQTLENGMRFFGIEEQLSGL